MPGPTIIDPRIVAAVLDAGAYEVSIRPDIPIVEAVHELRAIADRLEQSKVEDQDIFGEAR